MKKALSIEYAHIYSNQDISEDQKLSLEVLTNVKEENAGKKIVLVVMVDDYSFPDPSFDYGELADFLKERGFQPDLILRESQLIPVCDEVLSVVGDPKLKGEITNYTREKKYPCSLFIAAWYLLRLGYLKNPILKEELVAEKLINILPSSFKPFEDKGFEIIKSTPFAEAIDKIENKYFEGRSIN